MADEVKDKHTWLAENFLPKSEEKPRRNNLANISYHHVTRKTKLVMTILGCWGVYFPPYNIARLTALTRDAGYLTKVFDFNVTAYHDLKPSGLDSAWNSNHHYWWFAGEYEKRLHPTLEPFLLGYIDRICAENPDVIGFSVYDTNREPTEWTAKQIKKRLPNVKIIIGGPQCHMPDFIPPPAIDYWVAGEGEQILIDFLEGLENGQLPEQRKLGKTFGQNRINLDSLPPPDYSDYDFSLYTSSFGISAELSRGCVAKCSFCRETWFWKYRDRKSSNILDEIERQVKTYGINFVWFIDSLTNGNLKELRDFARGVVERGLDIKWMGYARCDGRMDLEYYKDLKASGCVNLSYGIESGSQKVLDLMRKNIKISDINSNLVSAARVGIFSHANWIVGAPGEDIQAMAHSLNLVWNHRARIRGLSPGVTLGDSVQTDYEFNRGRYNMSDWDKTFLGKWWSLDWSNTKIHRFIRLKYFYIWLKICKQHGIIDNNQARASIDEHYTVKFSQEKFTVDEVLYEDYDHMVFQPQLNPFADTVVNEIWGFFRMLWRVKGGFEMEVYFDKEQDKEEFGEYLSDDYEACHWIKIDKNGKFESRHAINFGHAGEHWMQGTCSFHYFWHGTGHMTENGIGIDTISEQKWADTFSDDIKIKEHSVTKNKPTKKIVMFDF